MSSNFRCLIVNVTANCKREWQHSDMNSILTTEIWDEIMLNYLTPRSLGLLECTCKTMKNSIKSNKVWEHQAVLAWNGFYVSYEEVDENEENEDIPMYSGDFPKFIHKACDAYRTDVEQFIANFRGTHEWYDWSDILWRMEVIDDDSNIVGYATSDPKVVIKNEIKFDEDWDGDEPKKREWVDELENEFWEDSDSNSDSEKNSEIDEYSRDSDDSYDSDSSWRSFTSSDLLDGEKTWQ